jgi:hypothetical protein
MRSIVFTESAVRYLQALTPRDRFSAVNAIEDLKRHPCLYQPWTEAGLRVMVCDCPKVIYDVSPDTSDNLTAGDVTILRILCTGMP